MNEEKLKEYYKQLREVNEARTKAEEALLDNYLKFSKEVENDVEKNNLRLSLASSVPYYVTYREINFTYDGYLEWLASDGASLLKFLPKGEQ